jgi:transposase-like protein
MQLPRATRLVVRIAGVRMYLWRAADHEGEVLDMLVQRRRDSRAALRLMRKLLKKQGFAPKLLVTDKLRSYASAFRRGGRAGFVLDRQLLVPLLRRERHRC